MAVDLHIHTTASDGIYTPEEVVSQAAKVSLQAIAITDHDTVNGISRAKIAAKDQNVEIIHGIELTAVYKNVDLHILGYCIDITKQEFLDKLIAIHDHRKQRAIKIISMLATVGINVDLTAILKISGTAPIGRPHIAKAMVNAGIVKTQEEAFIKYIGFSKPAYASHTTINPLDAVKLILLANGAPVLAHPGVNKYFMNVLHELIDNGLKGIEVYHPEHTTKQIKQYTKMAKKNNLIITGGTDFHGEHGNQIGSCSVNYDVVTELKQNSKAFLTS